MFDIYCILNYNNNYRRANHHFRWNFWSRIFHPLGNRLGVNFLQIFSLHKMFVFSWHPLDPLLPLSILEWFIQADIQWLQHQSQSTWYHCDSCVHRSAHFFNFLSKMRSERIPFKEGWFVECSTFPSFPYFLEPVEGTILIYPAFFVSMNYHSTGKFCILG